MKRFYRFLAACGGSWRNCVLISCRRRDGYLLTADRDGVPILMDIQWFQQMTGERVVPDECCGKLSESAFRMVFAQYLRWRFPEDSMDLLAELSRPGEN